GIEFAILVEVNDAQLVGRPDLTAGWIKFTAHQTKECGLAASVGADETYPHLRLDREIDSTKQCPLPNHIFEILDFDQLLAPPFGHGEVDIGPTRRGAGIQIGKFGDHFLRGIDPGAGFPGPGSRAPPEPLALIVDTVLASFLVLALSVDIFLFRLKDRA